jgi:hypothetical protein
MSTILDVNEKMRVKKVDDHWLYSWIDDLGDHSYKYNPNQEITTHTEVQNFKYVEKQVLGKNTRIYFGRPDVRIYTWKDNFGTHKYVLNLSK